MLIITIIIIYYSKSFYEIWNHNFVYYNSKLTVELNNYSNINAFITDIIFEFNIIS